MNRSRCLQMALSMLFIGISNTVNVEIAVLPNTLPIHVPYHHLENVTMSLEQANPHLEVHNASFRILNPVSSTTHYYRQLAQELQCNGTVMLVSTDECDPALTTIMGVAKQKTFRINRHLDCIFNYDSYPSVDVYPSNVHVNVGVQHVVSVLKWQVVNIFYDETFDDLLRKLTSAFAQHFSKIQLYKVDNETTSRDVLSILLASQKSQIDGDKNNNLIVCSVATVRKILEQAAILEADRLVHQDALYHTRWLVVLDDPADVFSVESMVQETVTNVGIFLVHQSFETGVTEAIEDLVTGLIAGLDYYLAETNDTDTIYVKQNGCLYVETSVVDDAIQPYLDSLPEYHTCTAFRAFTTEWTPSGYIRFVEEPLCNKETKKLQMIDFFPSERRGFNGRHFNITTVKNAPPFIFASTNSTGKTGICMDMLQELAGMLNFTYTLSEVPDGQYGVEEDDGWWTGMVGQVYRKEVDMAFAPLSANEARDAVIDFVGFFSEYGGILIKKPDENENKWRVIAEPFSWEVWIGIFLSVPVAGIVAWLITKLVVRVTTNEPDKFVEADSSLWYVFGALFTQGGAYEPSTTPGRAFIGCWWAFCIVIVASYGGSLIAFLTIAKGDAPFDNLEEMIAQSRYQYGTTGGSVYVAEFKQASGGILKDVWKGIESNYEYRTDVLSSSRNVHLAMVDEGNYAFITDRTTLEIIALQDTTCRLKLLPDTFLPMTLGIGIQEDANYKRTLERAVVILQQSGMVKFWQQKWRLKETCSSIPIPEAEKITLMDVQSAFYLLCGGIFFAGCALIAEFTRHMMQEKRQAESNEEQDKNNQNHKSNSNLDYNNGPYPYTVSAPIRSIYSYTY